MTKVITVGCGRYIQKSGAISLLKNELLLQKATMVYVLAGKNAWQACNGEINRQLEISGLEYNLEYFSGFCSFENAESHIKNVLEKGYNFIIGVGGGRCLDCSKVIGGKCGIPVALIPTQIATCVACTNMAVMYKSDGQYEGAFFPEIPIRFVLADTSIIANSPVRYTISGIFDSLAKRPELWFSLNRIEQNESDMCSAYAISITTWDMLLNNADVACSSNRLKLESEELSLVVKNNLLLTSMISALASGKKQLAIAHALYNHSTHLYPLQWRKYLHGEIVGVGVRLQLLFNEAADELLEKYDALLEILSAPKNLRDLEFATDEDSMNKLFESLIGQFAIIEESEKAHLRECLEKIK
jgi:glycerol dehydrogenase-like iron-containing ADH family enzyme